MLKPFFAGVGESAVLGPLLAMLAFPLLAIGMYGLSTGAATAVQFQGPRVWLRLPLAYLPIGIGLLIAAGTAAYKAGYTYQSATAARWSTSRALPSSQGGRRPSQVGP